MDPREASAATALELLNRSIAEDNQSHADFLMGVIESHRLYDYFSDDNGEHYPSIDALRADLEIQSNGSGRLSAYASVSDLAVRGLLSDGDERRHRSLVANAVADVGKRRHRERMARRGRLA